MSASASELGFAFFSPSVIHLLKSSNSHFFPVWRVRGGAPLASAGWKRVLPLRPNSYFLGSYPLHLDFRVWVGVRQSGAGGGVRWHAKEFAERRDGGRGVGC